MKYETHLRGVPDLERPVCDFHSTIKSCDEWAARTLAGAKVPDAYRFSAWVEVIVVERRVEKRIFTFAGADGAKRLAEIPGSAYPRDMVNPSANSPHVRALLFASQGPS